jgi:hypothetical protein
MPEQKTIHRAHADKRAGKASSTQAGEFVKEEVDRVRAGKHGVKSAKQAIAIGLSKARRAGVDLKAPKKGTTSEATRKKAAKDNAAGQHKTAAKSTSTESKAKRRNRRRVLRLAGPQRAVRRRRKRRSPPRAPRAVRPRRKKPLIRERRARIIELGAKAVEGRRYPAAA